MKIVDSFLVAFPVMLFLMGTVSFMTGLHNVDIAFNMYRYADIHNVEVGDYQDCNQFLCQDVMESYQSGFWFFQETIMFYFASFSLLIGIYLWRVFHAKN